MRHQHDKPYKVNSHYECVYSHGKNKLYDYHVLEVLGVGTENFGANRIEHAQYNC